MDNMELIYGVALMLILIPAKVILWKVIDETDTKKIWLYVLGLFLIYSAAMSGAVYAACMGAATVQECSQSVLVTFLIGNVIALIPGVLCYCVKNRRGLSEADKMKLRDM